MPSNQDKRIFECFMALETALTGRINNASGIADAINRLIDAHVQRAVSKREAGESR